MRKPTTADAQLLLQLYEMRREPDLRRARKWFHVGVDTRTWADIKVRVPLERWTATASSA
jgi:hypothetical protein